MLKVVVFQNWNIHITIEIGVGKFQSFSFQDIIWNQGDGTGSSRRKIIVYLTDEGVNSAGDGAKGGILTPAGKKD